MSNITRRTSLPKIPTRDPSGHKGSYGRVLIVAGSRGMSGAAGLCGLAALRGGSGLVTIACPESTSGVISSFEPSYLTLPMAEDKEGRLTEDCLSAILDQKCDCLAIGPGLGQSPCLESLLQNLLRQVEAPVVIDADGLNLLVDGLQSLKERSHPTILTPHPGEFSRLTGQPIADLQSARESSVTNFAQKHKVTVLLKGHQTVIGNGSDLAVNQTGNPGMATGGTGDVLTGLCASLIGQGMEPFDAAWLGAHLHGLAGDLAAQDLGQHSLIARDLVDYLPRAFQRYQQNEASESRA